MRGTQLKWIRSRPPDAYGQEPFRGASRDSTPIGRARQAGFGPFMAVYLSEHAWTQQDIGLVLTVGGLVALAAQMPGGVLVDAVSARRLLMSVAVAVSAASALMLALSPTFFVAIASYVLLAASTATLGPAMVTISLGLVGHAALGGRLGRNARFAAFGSGVAAAVMGACGHFFSTQSVFFLTAALALPAILALAFIRWEALPPETVTMRKRPHFDLPGLNSLAANRPLLGLDAGSHERAS